ncbi:DEKNAAE102326 [Brettanomyces naardenensis]|uniref:DEKNAAE102327 n=1 Tax=Brettanomyces naardenensis TaxID=13370 RepID=A0A448YK68_BRENA|nr:DEKNAAE102326 [Brettanomyces naardenensis]
MTTYEKLVEGATKIKLAPPKPKYVEPILMSTAQGEDSEAFRTVMKTLAKRLQDSAWTIVYKSLITLHIMIREGDGNVTIRYVSNHPLMLDCRIALGSGQYISNGGDIHTLATYAKYLSVRGEEFGLTRHDFIKEARRPVGAWSSKDVGSSLRKLAVEKGLLREIESVQRQIESLIRCRFKEPEVNSDLIVLGFRMLTTDLLSLYQTLNEGVLNILEHFFELSKVDAQRAFNIYTNFTKETSQVIDFLRVAKHLEHVTKLHVPTIKHAQTSLTDSLRDYIEDPYFDVNRRQYLAEQDAKKDGTEEAKNEKVENAPQSVEPVELVKPAQQEQQIKQQVTPSQPFFAQGSGAVAAVFDNPMQPVFTNQPATAQPSGLVLQTTGFNPFSNFSGFRPSTLAPVPEVPQQPVPAPMVSVQVQQQPPALFTPAATTGGLLFGHAAQALPLGQPQFTGIQQAPAPQQGIQPTESAVRGNIRRSSTNPFALGSEQQLGSSSSNPFAQTRFSSTSGTTALSFQPNRPRQQSLPQLTRSQTGSNPFASAAPAIVQQPPAQQFKRQATAGGLENLPTIPIFPETKKEAINQERQFQAAQELQQQKTENYLHQQQQVAANNPFAQPQSTAVGLSLGNPIAPQPLQQPQLQQQPQAAFTATQQAQVQPLQRPLLQQQPFSSVYTGPNLLG